MIDVILSVCDKNWALKSVLVASINMQDCRKTGMQICVFLKEILHTSDIFWSDKVSVFISKTDNEACACLSVDVLTKYVGSVRCVVHSLALCVNYNFKIVTVWKRLMEFINDVKTYFNQHYKAAQLSVEHQIDDGITNDRVKN